MAYMKGRNKEEREQCLTRWADWNKKWIAPALRDSNRDRDNGRERTPQDNKGRRDQRGDPKRPFRTSALECMEDICQAYCHKVGLNIGDVADQMDWKFFAACTQGEEFGLVDSSSDAEDTWDDDEGENK